MLQYDAAIKAMRVDERGAAAEMTREMLGRQYKVDRRGRNISKHGRGGGGFA